MDAEIVAATAIPAERVLAKIVRAGPLRRFALELLDDRLSDEIRQSDALRVKSRSQVSPEVSGRRMVIVIMLRPGRITAT